MEKKLPKRLLLNKETVRLLKEPELKPVAGGLPTERTCSQGLCCPEW